MRSVIRPLVCLLAVIVVTVTAAPAAATQEREQPTATGACETCDAEQQQKPGQPTPQPTPQQPRAPTPAPRAGSERQPERQPEGRPVNLQIELTITDQVESEPAQKKTVSMIVADRSFGRVRASGAVQLRESPGPPVSVQLNVDARPAILANETIRLELTLEYQPLPPGPATQTSLRPMTLNESLTVILQPGKPLTVSRAVDPFTNRRTSVDVTVTIMK